MIEIFKDIPGYEGLYQVSNLGNVKSLNYRRTKKEKILKPGKQSGYLSVILFKEKKGKNFHVHRLVADTFLPNPDNLPCVNHKDENKLNNYLNNLEFCSYSYNVNYGTRNEKISTKISCLDLETNKTTYFPSINETARQLNTNSFAIQWALKNKNIPYKNRYILKKIGK